MFTARYVIGVYITGDESNSVEATILANEMNHEALNHTINEGIHAYRKQSNEVPNRLIVMVLHHNKVVERKIYQIVWDQSQYHLIIDQVMEDSNLINLLSDDFIEKEISKGQIELLKEKIDLALEERDEKEFFRLTNKLKKILETTM